MTYVKNIHGLGSKGADSYYDDNLTTPNVCKFNGSTWYIIGSYDPLPTATARTYLSLSKRTTSGSPKNLYSTRVALNNGEFINYSSSGLSNMTLQNNAATERLTLLTDHNLALGKWATNAPFYDGSGFITNSYHYTNGFRSDVINANNELIADMNNGVNRGVLGCGSNGLQYFFTGEIAIFSIYKGVLTSSQNTEYASDPFGFLARLRASNHLDFYLDVDFNKTTGNLPIDLSPNAFPITLGAGTATFEPFA